MNSSSKGLIYIVEDDVDIRNLEEYALLGAGYTVEAFASSEPFWTSIDKEIPSLIILDVMLPKEDGVSILRNLKNAKATRDIPVIMITAKTSEMDHVKSLDIGADDYINKPFGVLEMISRVKAVLRRSTNYSGQSIIKFKKLTLDENKHSVLVDDAPCELAYKEFEILKFLLNNKNMVISRDLLLEKVWGFDFEGESRTVDVHITTLRKKLGEAGEYIKTVRGVGYIISD